MDPPEEKKENNSESPNRRPKEETFSVDFRPTDDSVDLTVRFASPDEDQRESMSKKVKKVAPMVASFKDHFTLPVPSSVVRYRNSGGAARVIEGTDFQFVLEEKYDAKSKTREVTIRRIQDSTSGLRMLRACYTLVTALWTGFLFVLAMQILLFLFLDLALELGVTSDESPHWGTALGAILAVIPLINGLAECMVIAGSFVMDAWRGHLFVREFTFGKLSDVAVEWVFFAFFLGLPIFVMGCTLLSKTDEWWTIAAIFWIVCIGIFYVIFSSNVVFYELKTSIQVMRNKARSENNEDWNISYFQVFKRSVLLRQVATYGGRMQRTYLSRGTIDDAEYTDKFGEDDLVQGTLRERKTWMTTLVSPFIKFGWFIEYDRPTRFYTVDDARDVRPFVTAHTWSLEKIFCRPPNSRYIAIIRGAGAVSRAQMKSSFLCSFLGSFLILFLLACMMVYLEAGIPATMCMVAIAVLLSIPNFMNTFRLYTVGKDVIHANSESKTKAERSGERHKSSIGTERDLPDVPLADRECPEFEFAPTDSEGLYLVDELYKLSRPSNTTAWAFFWLEIILLLIWPVVGLFAVGNWQLGLLYLLISGVTAFRYYINAALVLEDVGHMEMVSGKSERALWRNKSRLNSIVGDITRGRSKRFWVLLISIFALAFLGLFGGAIGVNQETEEVADPAYTYLPTFQYKPIEDSLRYPTCHLTSDLQGSPLTSMADYIFLARVAYRGSTTQRELDSWFGPNVAVDQSELVSAFRRENDIRSQVSFKLITYPTTSGKDFAYLAIRGTTNQWEALTDAQLWGAAMLMQALREILPLGSMWTPVMPYFIRAMTYLQSSSIDEISFYKDTVTFADYLKRSDYSGVAVTGHSLGGGLSMITGAISKIPSVAVSGPNTVLTRRSLDPPVSKEDLDRYTFNIRPDRDLVPLFDDPAQNVQGIRCNADFIDVVGCHDSTRALCEAIYTCGTDGRPALCECVTEFRFPEPAPVDPNGGMTFAQACGLPPSQ